VKKLLALLFACLTGLALAEPVYVTDQFSITLRSGESSQHRIISMISSGTRLERISRNPETGYTKVRLPSGREGFVLTRQLLDEPVARDQLAELQAEVDALKAAPGELQQRLSGLTEQHSELQRAHTELQQIKQEIEQELAALKRTSSNAVRISNERNELRKQVAELTRSNEELKAEKRELENQGAQRWFMIGSGVVVGGILIGLLLPHLRIRRRKDSWGSL
jgi:SH3 domain protein